MAHDCPDCSRLCYCDSDDTFLDAHEDCAHACEPEYDDDFEPVGEERT